MTFKPFDMFKTFKSSEIVLNDLNALNQTEF